MYFDKLFSKTYELLIYILISIAQKTGKTDPF